MTAQWVTQPILTLNESAQALTAGEWQKRVTLNRQDEVGQLAQSFKPHGGPTAKNRLKC